MGYTIDELKQLIKEDTYPIYTIGCRTGKNDSQLENLFALSRQSNAAYFLMESDEDTISVADALGKDREIVKVVVEPPADLMDGSTKTVKINFQGQSVSKEVRMPQQEKAEVVETPETEPETPESSIEESEPESEEETSAVDEEALRKAAAAKFIIMVIAAWICVILVIIIVIAVRRSRRKQRMEQDDAETLMKQREQELSEALPDSPVVYIVLTDVHIPGNSFRIPVSSPVVIGRSKENCNLVVEYNNSISGRHCAIYLQNGRVMVKDLNSTNGTFVNGSRISRDTELVSGCTIMLGNLELRFDIENR